LKSGPDQSSEKYSQNRSPLGQPLQEVPSSIYQALSAAFSESQVYSSCGQVDRKLTCCLTNCLSLKGPACARFPFRARFLTLTRIRPVSIRFVEHPAPASASILALSQRFAQTSLAPVSFLEL